MLINHGIYPALDQRICKCPVNGSILRTERGGTKTEGHKTVLEATKR